MSSSCDVCAYPISRRNWYQCAETGRGPNKGKPHMQVHKTCIARWAKSQEGEGKRQILCVQPGCNTDISYLLPKLKRAVYFLDKHPVVAMSATLLPTQASRYILGDWGGIVSCFSAAFVVFSLAIDDKISERSCYAMLSGGAVAFAWNTVAALTNVSQAPSDWQKNVLLVSFVAFHTFSLITAIGAVWDKRLTHIDRVAALFIPFIGLGVNLNTILKLA